MLLLIGEDSAKLMGIKCLWLVAVRGSWLFSRRRFITYKMDFLVTGILSISLIFEKMFSIICLPINCKYPCGIFLCHSLHWLPLESDLYRLLVLGSDRFEWCPGFDMKNHLKVTPNALGWHKLFQTISTQNESYLLFSDVLTQT